MNDTSEDGSIAAKRRKFDNLVDGSIVKVELKNFMTFTEAKYYAHPKLNLIIGPNGSGKSSIVTALILGFGGNPKDINRGDKVSQFVKMGKSVADISIELYNKSKQNTHLKRTIFTSNDTCHYFLNNLMVTKKKYIEVVESFNIKVHNLCQFLPQDRLEDFSKLDSKGLLLNTLQSVEDQELLNNFEKLKELASSMCTFDTDQKKLQEQIRLETGANLKLETIVNTFTKKKSLEKELLVVLQKRSWTLYIMGWRLIKSEIKKFDEGCKHNHEALSLIKQQKKIIQKKKSGEMNLKMMVLQNASIVSKLLEKLNNRIEVAECNLAEMKDLNETFKKSTNKIEDYKASISAMKEKLESIRNEMFNVEENKQELAEINKKILNIDENIQPMKVNLESVKNKMKGLTAKVYAIDQELEGQKRKEDGKNELLRRKYPEMWKAIQWLRKCDKKSIFKGQVFEPLFTQIEVIDLKNAKFIESIINYRDMIAFVFEFAEDLTTFNKIVKEERWQKINSISAPPANFRINENPNYDINSLKKFGFFSYALDMIKAPSVIRRYLVKNYDMHNIPIGTNQVISNMQHIPSNIGVFFAGNDQVIVKTSMYTGEKITRQTQISNTVNFLVFSVDSNLIKSLTINKENVVKECEQYDQQITELINQLRITEDSRQPFYARKKEIHGRFMKFQNRQKAFDKMSKDLELTQSELVKEQAKSVQLIHQNSNFIDKYFEAMKEIVEQLENYATCSKTFIASAFTINYCFVDMNEENKILLQLKTLYETNLNNLNDYNKYVQQLQTEFKNMRNVAVHWTQGVSPYDKNLFQPFKEKFDSIEQDNIEDLDLLIVEKKAKLNCLNIDPQAPMLIHEYKERKVKIKILEKKLVDLNNNAQSKESQIEKLHSSWLPKLNDLVGLLSMNFKKFLMTFGCNGVIEFQSGVTRYDFQSYGLSIKVQFRDDDPSLRQLDARSQSGGERALSTAVFLLALQEVTHFPFRIVDEINQGMDKVYERKLMELYMELFEDRNSQYIIVTPKLIKNLSFKNTTVDIIFSIKK